MRIVINDLQSQDVLSEVEPTVGKSVVGGNSLNANVNVSAYSDNAKSRSSAGVSGYGSYLSGTFTANAQTGENFSLGDSSSYIESSE
jgi:hypothetical protein